ncbi:MAG: hypothetical protein R3284_12935 [Rubricoccaceae bacterium]|nr:hypothetical protein [Rubricoccaceae bacterium]
MRVFLVSVLVILWGCGGVRPGGELLPQYAAAPTANATIPRPSYELDDERGLSRFVEEIAEALMRHDIRTLAYMLHAGDYAQQFAFMKGDDRSDEEVVAQIIEETYGLRVVGNVLLQPELRNPEQPFAGLNRIRSVDVWTAEENRPGFWDIEGHVGLDDRTSRSLTFTIYKPDGEWHVVVPQG